MIVQAIYSCKLFKHSTRQSKILAALADPINDELVKQLEGYLDDEFKPLVVEDTEVDDVENGSDSERQDAGIDSVKLNKPNVAPPRSHGGAGDDRLSEKYGDDLVAEGDVAFEMINPDVMRDSAKSEKDTTATTMVSKTSVVAETVVTKPLVENHVTLSGLAGELKGTLNARSTTTGVSRVSTKNDEVWIYYNDDINLNNVMTSVIDVLNAANYHYLLFNRLARTDNAMVFTINSNDTANMMESMSNE